MTNVREPAGWSQTVLSGGARVRKKDREEKKISKGHTVKAAAPSLFSTILIYPSKHGKQLKKC